MRAPWTLSTGKEPRNKGGSPPSHKPQPTSRPQRGQNPVKFTATHGSLNSIHGELLRAAAYSIRCVPFAEITDLLQLGGFPRLIQCLAFTGLVSLFGFITSSHISAVEIRMNTLTALKVERVQGKFA